MGALSLTWTTAPMGSQSSKALNLQITLSVRTAVQGLSLTRNAIGLRIRLFVYSGDPKTP